MIPASTPSPIKGILIGLAILAATVWIVSDILQIPFLLFMSVGLGVAILISYIVAYLNGRL